MARTNNLSSRAIIVTLTLTLALAASCRWPVPACPAKGGPAWSRLEVPHFEIWTDLDNDFAELVAYDLERLRAALAAAAWPSVVDRGGKLAAIILRDRVELSSYMDQAGLFAPNAGVHDGLIVAAGDVNGRVFKHELAHALSLQYGLPPTAPAWLVEGIACYLESTTFGSPAGQLRYGDPGERSDELVRHDIRSFRSLRNGNDLTPAFYGSSWLLVHFLMNQRRAELQLFQDLLARRVPEKLAWSAIFTDLPEDRVDGALADYVRQGRYFVTQRPWTPPMVTPTRRTLPDADAHAARALLIAAAATALSNGERRKKTGEEVGEALRQDPDNQLARQVRRHFLGQ